MAIMLAARWRRMEAGLVPLRVRGQSVVADRELAGEGSGRVDEDNDGSDDGGDSGDDGGGGGGGGDGGDGGDDGGDEEEEEEEHWC